VHKISFPDWQLEEWLAFAKRVAKLSNSGRVVLDYDMRIAEPFRIAAPVAGMDMWAAWRTLQEVPALVVRGEISDILSADTLDRMQAEHPDAEALTLPGIGHAPRWTSPRRARRSGACSPASRSGWQLPDRRSASSTPIRPSRWAARKRGRSG
jgi:pimeloyl-ACP methyl ester carboxylesterase